MCAFSSPFWAPRRRAAQNLQPRILGAPLTASLPLNASAMGHAGSLSPCHPSRATMVAMTLGRMSCSSRPAIPASPGFIFILPACGFIFVLFPVSLPKSPGSPLFPWTVVSCATFPLRLICSSPKKAKLSVPGLSLTDVPTSPTPAAGGQRTASQPARAPLSVTTVGDVEPALASPAPPRNPPSAAMTAFSAQAAQLST